MRTAASLLALVLAATPASAFDCGKAKTKVEKAICANPALEATDDALGAAYGEVRSLSSRAERRMLAKAQRRWLRLRETSCGGGDAAKRDACIADMTGARLKMFRAEPESGPGTGSRLIPVFIAQDGTEKAYDIEFNLLRFAAPKGAGEKSFNAFTGAIAARARLGDHDLADVGRVLSAVEDVTVAFASPKLLSAVESYWSDDGGAHGNGGINNLNLDMATGRELGIADFFSEAAAADLVKRCREGIVAEKKARLGDPAYDPATDDFLKDEVIAEHMATLSRWTFWEGKAEVNFNAYAIGPYAEGPYTCTFAMADLKALALPTAPLP